MTWQVLHSRQSPSINTPRTIVLRSIQVDLRPSVRRNGGTTYAVRLLLLQMPPPHGPSMIFGSRTVEVASKTLPEGASGVRVR